MNHLEQVFTLDSPPQSAWPAFADIEMLVECLPGAALAGAASADEVPLVFTVKLGPISASFAGTGRLSLDPASMRGRFEGEAEDKRTRSRVKGHAEFALVPDPTGTRVDVGIEYTLSGSLAQFGRPGIVRGIATSLTNRFAGNLSQRLRGADAAVPSGGTGAAAGTAPDAHADAATAAPSQNAPPPGKEAAADLAGLLIDGAGRGAANLVARLRGRSRG